MPRYRRRGRTLQPELPHPDLIAVGFEQEELVVGHGIEIEADKSVASDRRRHGCSRRVGAG
jgi:hypothetical protein